MQFITRFGRRVVLHVFLLKKTKGGKTDVEETGLLWYIKEEIIWKKKALTS